MTIRTAKQNLTSPKNVRNEEPWVQVRCNPISCPFSTPLLIKFEMALSSDDTGWNNPCTKHNFLKRNLFWFTTIV